MDEEILRAQISIELPSDKWTHKLSKEFLNITFNILSMSLVRENICNTLITLSGNQISDLISKLKTNDSIIEYLIISNTPTSTLLNVKVRNPWVLISTIENEVSIKYPIKIHNGWSDWEIYSTRERIHSLFNDLQLIGLNIKLKSIGKHKKKPLLTLRQSEIMNIAMNEGFYNVPRNLTLIDLAKKIEISSSTLSETLRKINKKLVNLI